MAERRKKAEGAWQCPPKLLSALSVALFAMLGLAIRVALAELTQDVDFGVTTTRPRGVPVSEELLSPADRMPCLLKSSGSGYFLQNALGCFLMAAIARHKHRMNEHLAVGLASGLCGSLTTFATWMGEEAITIANGFTFEACVSVVSMLCVSVSCYRLGHYAAHCGAGDEPRCFDDLCGLRALVRRRGAGKAALEEDSSDGSSSEDEPSAGGGGSGGGGGGALPDGLGLHSDDEARPEDEEWGLRVDTAASWHEPEQPRDVVLNPRLQLAILVLAGLCLAGYLGACVGYRFTKGLWYIAFAPFGAMLRWYLSLFNPRAVKKFYGLPLFTLTANLLGTLCNALAAAFHARVEGDVAPLVLAAVSTGFAGSLSTVSTLVAELRGGGMGSLRVRILYFVVSVGLAMAIELPVLLVLRC